MTYEQLVDFLQNRMRMSHVYQPVMLMTLLQQGGKCSITEIARSILAHDQSQVEYYEDVTKNMVGRVLRRHGIVSTEGGSYSLVGYENLDVEQVEHLIEMCQLTASVINIDPVVSGKHVGTSHLTGADSQRLYEKTLDACSAYRFNNYEYRCKLNEYKAKRGERIWQHRKMSAGYISGTLRYEVLKRARFRCELCGVSADVRVLEVDHIVPRSRGGTDDPDNLQALCYRCNAMKRDRDDTDFRKVGESYERREQGCPFCEVPKDRMVGESELAYAIRDAFPVAPLHTLVIPKRHVQGYFELGRPELNACHRLLEHEKKVIELADGSVEGFNIGVNDGEAAGQTIFHCHFHLIPRRKGDIEEPTGGVRNIIPGKGVYR